ncbi:MAG TPA: DUF1697 domain-containing protein [bacterium]|nr:DUF1697 domain-containing protein [bacterium]
MPRLIALLRAINVGRGRVVKMDRLRREFAAMSFSDVETFIASGNVLFASRAGNVAALEQRIGERLGGALGYDVGVFIRTPDQLQAIAHFAPFRADEPGPRLPDNVIFLAAPPRAAARRAVAALRTATDDFRIRGREIYWRRRRKPGTTVFSTVPLEKALGTAFTIRNAGTVTKLAAMCRPDGGKRNAQAAVPVRTHDVGGGQRRRARRPRRADSRRDH